MQPGKLFLVIVEPQLFALLQIRPSPRFKVETGFSRSTNMGVSKMSVTGPQPSAFESPRDCGKEHARNPYDYIPRAPPRGRESGERQIDFRILPAKKPLPHRIFLDIDEGSQTRKKRRTCHDKFAPIAPAPSLQPRSFTARKPKPSKPISNKNSDASAVPQLSVSWVQKRPLVLRAGERTSHGAQRTSWWFSNASLNHGST